MQLSWPVCFPGGAHRLRGWHWARPHGGGSGAAVGYTGQRQRSDPGRGTLEGPSAGPSGAPAGHGIVSVVLD